MCLLPCVLNKVAVGVCCLCGCLSAFTLISKLLGNIRFHAVRINQCFFAVTVWFYHVNLSPLLKVKEEKYFKIL